MQAGGFHDPESTLDPTIDAAQTRWPARHRAAQRSRPGRARRAALGLGADPHHQRPDRRAQTARLRHRASTAGSDRERPDTAATTIGETAGGVRFRTHAKLARTDWVRTNPVASGRADCHRVDRGGNGRTDGAKGGVPLDRVRQPPPGWVGVLAQSNERRRLGAVRERWRSGGSLGPSYGRIRLLMRGS